MQIIFVVSDEEMNNYAPFSGKGITVVGYDGFGMGCGRAVGVQVAKQLNRPCFMTDDRTVNLLKSSGDPLDLKDGELLKCLEKKAWISGVHPKGELNILTIINPKSTKHNNVTFSKYFIASKEDKALYHYCQALSLVDPTEVGMTDEDLRVKFDSNNPNYINKAPAAVEQKKGARLDCMNASQLYRSLDGTPIDWNHLNKKKGFLNKWDAIKIQDSAMYELLESICKEMADNRDTLDAAFWKEFHANITPWFS